MQLIHNPPFDNPGGSASGFAGSAGRKIKDVESQLLLTTPAVYFQVIDDVEWREYFGSVVAQSEADSIPDAITLPEFHSQVLIITAHGAAANNIHPAADEGRGRITTTKGGQPASRREGIPAQAGQGNLSVDIQLRTEVDPG